jgi:hypothetical protein
MQYNHDLLRVLRIALTFTNHTLFGLRYWSPGSVVILPSLS